MADMLQDALVILSQTNKEVRGTVVSYYRGTDYVSITATIGKSIHRIPQANGLYLKTETIDWLMIANDLVLSEYVVEPAPGDVIHWTDGNGAVHHYEAQPVGDENCFRYSDPGRTSLRVHTQQIDLQ